eukprot:g2871.t1
MTYINLSGNHIGIGGMEAIEALADAMQENDTLLELCLHEQKSASGNVAQQIKPRRPELKAVEAPLERVMWT